MEDEVQTVTRGYPPAFEKQVSVGFAAVPGICLAGALYPLGWLLVWSLFNLQYAFALSNGGELKSVSTAILFVIGSSLFGGMLALCLGFFAQIALTFVNFSLKYPFSPGFIARCGGGLAGYVCTAPLCVWHVRELLNSLGQAGGGSFDLEAFFAATASCLAATCFGTLGATCALRFVPENTRMIAAGGGNIGTAQMLVLTAWFAVLSCIQSFSPGSAFLPALIGWLILQPLLINVFDAISRTLRRRVVSPIPHSQ